MRIKARLWGPILGVGLLLLVAHDAPSIAAERSGTPWLGVYSQELNDGLREGLDYSGSGVLVNRVVPDSPADRAGLKQGDVIVRVDARSVDTPDELARVIRSAEVGEVVRLHIVRSGERETLEVRLDDRPGEELDVPVPRRRMMERAPAPPAAPKAPHAPEVGDRTFHFEFPEEGLGMFQGMGRGRLGVRVESLNPDLGEYFDVKDGRGALVLEVLKDSPAERAGLKAGDVITSVGDRTVYGADDLVSELRGAEGRVSLTAIRHGARRTFEAELEKNTRAFRMDRDGIMGWKDDEGRVHIRSAPRVQGQEREEMRRELEEMRKELQELRRELKEMQR